MRPHVLRAGISRARQPWRSVSLKVALFLAVTIGAGVLFAAPAATYRLTTETLDAYAKDEFDIAASFLEGRPLLNSGDLDKIAADLERVGPGWIDNQPKRRLVAATFALEMARAIGMRRVRPPDPQAHMPLVAQRFLAWGCARLRDDLHPQDTELLWHFAAISVADAPGRGLGNATAAEADAFGRDWDVFLLGNDWPRAPMASSASAPSDSQNALAQELTEGHLAHALARLPTVAELQFEKARAVMAATRAVGDVGVPIEQQSGLFAHEITPDYIARLSSGSGASSARAVVAASGNANEREVAIGRVPPTDELLRINELRNARAIFEQLAVPGPLEAYSHLCAGVIALRLADRAGALEHFAALDHLAPDPALHYDARALSGVVHERRQEWDQAIASYKSALVLMPHARFAGTRLTTLLLRLGRNADAETFEDAFLAAPAQAADRVSKITSLLSDAADPVLSYDVRINSLFADAFDQLKRAIQR